MKVSTKHFGTLPDGTEVKQFSFETDEALSVKISNFGAAITSIRQPGKYNPPEEITAGFPILEPYRVNDPYFGVTVGRFANRIAKGRFSIGNKEYQLAVNNGPNHLHGGIEAFHKQIWEPSLEEKPGKAILILKYISPDGEEGYPGQLIATVIYTVSDDNSLEIRYEATSDKPTHINLTNHTYFNLGGFKGTVADHHLYLNADQYLQFNNVQIPTGKLLPCQGTPMDFSQPQKLETQKIPEEKELDHCFVLNTARKKNEPAAILYHEASGRRLTIFTTQPGIQVYTSNHLDGTLQGHEGTIYQKHHAICLETQHFPDTPNQSGFPSTLLRPGEIYRETNTWYFDTL